MGIGDAGCEELIGSEEGLSPALQGALCGPLSGQTLKAEGMRRKRECNSASPGDETRPSGVSYMPLSCRHCLFDLGNRRDSAKSGSRVGGEELMRIIAAVRPVKPVGEPCPVKEVWETLR